MGGQRFEIEHLRAFARQRLQQTAFAAAGGRAHDAIVQPGRQAGELGDDMPSIGLVAAIELHRGEADFLQDVGHRPATAAAAPAIHQRAIGFGFVGEMVFEVLGDIARHQCRADFLGFERRNLLVYGADALTLGVVQYRQIDGAGECGLLQTRRGNGRRSPRQRHAVLLRWQRASWLNFQEKCEAVNQTDGRFNCWRQGAESMPAEWVGILAQFAGDLLRATALPCVRSGEDVWCRQGVAACNQGEWRLV